MGGFGSFLMALAGPLAKKVLISLGFGVVSYAAMSIALDQVLQAAKLAWSGLAGEALQLIQLAGVNTAASILAGALVARVALQTMNKIALIK